MKYRKSGRNSGQANTPADHMVIEHAFYVAKKIMVKNNMEIFFRGCPRHVIENGMGINEGKYNPGYHIVITGPVWDAGTLVHECTHALQKINALPKDYYLNHKVYTACKFEKEAFMVEKIFMSEY